MQQPSNERTDKTKRILQVWDLETGKTSNSHKTSSFSRSEAKATQISQQRNTTASAIQNIVRHREIQG